MQPSKPILRFGVFEVDLAGGELFKQGLRIKLQEQPFQVLVALIERAREVVTRDELRQRLWPNTQVDFERGLNKAINRLREALGDDADNPRFIETIPQRGYRFLLPVETALPLPAAPALAEPIPSGRLINRRGVFTIAGGVLTVSLGTGLYRRLGSAPPRIESLAVLPLENLSGDPAQEYFSEGMTDELIGEIGRTVPVRVTSRTSVMRYKRGPRKSLQQIAAELNADAILEGSVAQSGREVRINVRLVRVRDDRQLWSNRYKRNLAEILGLQNEVARAVALGIKTNLTPRQPDSPARERTVNPEAYTVFLKANYLLHQGIAGIARSAGLFSEAIRLDPGHAASYAGLAEALVFCAIFEIQSSEGAFPEARAAASRALEIDPSNGPAHNALADVKKGYDWDLAGAEVEYLLALRLDPNHLLTRLWYGDCLSRMCRHDEALEQSNRSLALDPVSPVSYVSRAMLLWRARRYDEAIRFSRQAIDLVPQFVNALWWQGLSYAAKGDFAKSIESLSKATTTDAGPLSRAMLGHVYGLAGERSKALMMIEEVTGIKRHRSVSPMDFAILHAGLGDAESTFRWLEEAYRARAVRMHEIDWMYFDRFRADPRHLGLLRRAGLRG